MKKLINLAFAHIDLGGVGQDVVEGRYDLEGPGHALILPSLWEATIQPGWHIWQKLWPPDSSSLRRPRPPTRAMKGDRVQPHVPREDGSHRSQRPLNEAVEHGDEELVQLLLQHGANARLQGLDGRSASKVAEDVKSDLADVIKEGVPLLGPSTSTPDTEQSSDAKDKVPLSRPRAPPRGSMKWLACNNFEATVIQFHLSEKEERYQKNVSIHELLYGKGPHAVFATQSPTRTKPNFTWYHLPANNVSLPLHHIIMSTAERLRADDIS